MIEYECHLARENGTKVTLRRQAPSEDVLLRDLNNEGFLILRIGPVQAKSIDRRGRLKPKSVLKFVEILESLTANGLSLKEALGLARPLGGKDLGPFLTDLDVQIQKGQSLYQALRDGPKGFSPLFLGLVRIGEQTGDLSAILPRLVEYLKVRQALREKTINALVYPVFVLTVALVGVALLSLFVLPALTDSISGVNPLVARSYQNNVAGFQTTSGALFFILLLVLLTVLGLRLTADRSPQLAQTWDGVLLRLPLVGSWIRQAFCLNASFALEILLTSGFSLEAALLECDTLIQNRALKASWSRARERVVKGSTLSQALRQEELYPDLFLGWIEVGESAHDLRKSFRNLRSYYQNQADLLAARFANLAEPTLIVVVGGLVILLVMTFVTPIFTMLGGIL